MDSNILDKICTEFYQYLLPRVKNLRNDFALAESSILQQLQKRVLTFEQIYIMDSLLNSKERIFKEMSAKQKLITSDKEKWSLTDLGRVVMNFSERSEKNK